MISTLSSVLSAYRVLPVTSSVKQGDLTDKYSPAVSTSLSYKALAGQVKAMAAMDRIDGVGIKLNIFAWNFNMFSFFRKQGGKYPSE